jgi:glucose/arabinose dehydrogenase
MNFLRSHPAGFALVAASSCLSLVCLSTPGVAAIQLSPVVSSGLSSPLFVGHAADGSDRLFIVQRGGIIKVLQPGSSTPTDFLNITGRVLSGGERGLLGLAFHPQYASNGRFFVYYTRISDGDIVIAEYGVSADPNIADTAETILITIEHSANSNHNGGMMAFDTDGYLRIGVGDGGGGNDPPNNAQNINTLLGKILRIDVDVPNPPALYSSPPSNPYVGLAGRDEIFSIGWRNPWRWSFDRQTGQMWVADVGQDAREEVDTPIENGGNYGWRVFEGIACNTAPGLDQSLCVPSNFIFPIFDYTQSGGRCSITGGYVYRGAQQALPLGTYVYGDFCSGEIFAWNGTSQIVALDTTLSISSFGEDEEGELYVVHLGGTVSKIVSTTAPTATPTRTPTAPTATPTLTPTRTPTAPPSTATPTRTPTRTPTPQSSTPTPPACTFNISPTSVNYPRPGGSGSVAVAASVGCSWTAVSNVSWITIVGPSSGSGNGSVSYSVATYTGKPKRRTGTATIAGRTFSVTQTK